MKIIIGRGNNRHVFQRENERVARERQIEDLKNFLFRPKLLDREGAGH
jgi:hypothetical protein